MLLDECHLPELMRGLLGLHFVVCKVNEGAWTDFSCDEVCVRDDVIDRTVFEVSAYWEYVLRWMLLPLTWH